VVSLTVCITAKIITVISVHRFNSIGVSEPIFMDIYK
jgi:hypothetical protein